MSCLGVHFALSPEDRERVLKTPNEEKRKSLVREDIEERYLSEGEWAYETDKAWDAIHRSLTDGTLSAGNAFYPLNLCILGGKQLYSREDYFICLVESREVAKLAAALKSMTRETFRENYFRIDPSRYGMPLSEEDFEYTWEHFEGLPSFFEKAAKAGRSVLFTADQ